MTLPVTLASEGIGYEQLPGWEDFRKTLTTLPNAG